MRGFTPRGGEAAGPVASPLAFVTALGALIVVTCTATWAAAGGGYFWPSWVILGCATVLLPILWRQHLRGKANTPRSRVQGHLEVSVTLSAALVLVWAFSGAQGPWVLWSVIGLGAVLGTHALIDLRDELPSFGTRKLQERVDTLSRTRRQAVDAQAAELRRIERDLHDGAQARLVVLTMQLGRAEAAVAHEPKAAALVRAAREEANLAIRELRDLTRGIAPPVLADRGLVAAVQSLTQRGRATLEVVGANDGRRPPPTVEGAAYFVVAEALTNATKHASGAAVHVRIAFTPDAVTLDVTDDGQGNVDQAGTGVQGLRARVEALDGTFVLTSPAGGPTHVHAEVPCA